MESRPTLLTTKLSVGPLPTGYVPRPALRARLDRALRARLTLVSAPPGYGKTTLLAGWLAGLESTAPGRSARVAWLSLDAADSDPVRFLRYLLSALDRAMPGCAAAALPALDAPQPPDFDAVLGPVVNEIATLPADLIVILDDYHLIEAQAVHHLLTCLLDNLPPHAHLLLATRADPPLPLARWRARGQLLELRAADLRFSEDEAGALVEHISGIGLSGSDISTLQQRTEGWAAGLQMAALSLQRQTPEAATRFIAAFSGSNSHVVDYLVEEVLARQTPGAQAFLLRTAILTRLSAPLSAAVVPGTDEEQAQQMLEHLARANLFLTALDENREWFRYHRLFADLLVARLRRTPEWRAAHAAAAAWLNGRGLVDEAMEHALAAGDHALAGHLLEAHWADAIYRGEVSTALRWLEALPTEVVRANAHLGAAFCWVLLYRGELARLTPYLAAAEAAAFAGRQEDEGEPGGEAQALLLALRSNLVRLLPDAGKAEMLESCRLARQGVAAAPAGSVGRAAALVSLGQALRDLDRPIEAISAYEEALPLVWEQGNLLVAAGTVYNLARLLLQTGHLQKALLLCREALAQVEGNPAAQSPATGQLHLALAGVLTERNELGEAEAHLERGQALVRRGGQLDLLRLVHLARARLQLARGDVSAALTAATEAERIGRQVGGPALLREAAAALAVARARAGQTSEARRWVDALPSPPSAAEELAAAHVLYLSGKPEGALAHLEGLLASSEAQGRMGTRVAALILAALCQSADGRSSDAVLALAEALRIGGPEGYVRVFLDEGLPMLALLRRAAARGVQPGTVVDLLAAGGASSQALAGMSFPAPPTEPPLPPVEPLTERELEVLRLLAGYLSNTQIAARMTVSSGTVKTHIHHIYGKLGVAGRAEAIERARHLRLI